MRLHKDTNNEVNSFRQHKDTGEKKPTRYYSSRQEQSVAQAVGGKQTANSGATMFQKGDVIINEDTTKWSLECKTKTSDCDSISVKKEWFDKNRSESIFMKTDYTAVVISFGPSSENIYCIDENTFKEMKHALNICKANNLID